MRYLIIILLGCSCSANWHIKKAIKKDPSLLLRDTITVIDTVRSYSERVEVDSVFMISSDTTVIIRDNLRIQHYIHNDSVFIEGECDSVLIEIPYEVKIPYDRIIYDDGGWKKWIPWILLLTALILIYLKVNK